MEKEYKIIYREFSHLSELSESDRELVSEAKKASLNAYAPYSRFHVGAALRAENLQLFRGNNQENIAYPSGLCAERVALFHFGATHPSESIESIAVFAKGDLLPEEECVTPCGSCRQVMLESEKRQGKPIRLILAAESGKTLIFDSVKDLMVFPFGTNE